MRARRPAARTSVRRALLLGGAVLMLSVMLGACGGVVGSVLSTRQALDNAGFSHASVSLGGETNVKVSATVDQSASAAEVRDIASIVWRNFHERFDFLDVTLHATDRTERGSIPFLTLQQEFGARSPADNKATIRSGIIRVGLEVLGGAAAVVLVVIVLIVLVVRRRRRRSGPPAGSAHPGTAAPATPWPYGPVGSPGPDRTPGPDAPWGAPDRTPGPDAPWGAPDRTPGPDAPWGAPVPAPAPPPDPWQPPPGSGPQAW